MASVATMEQKNASKECLQDQSYSGFVGGRRRMSDAGWRMIGLAALMFVALGALIWLATKEDS